MKAELLINVRSRIAREAYSQIHESLKRNGITITHETKLRKGDNLGTVLRSVIKRSPKLLIIGGGDGTVSDAVDELAGTDITIAVLPLGTTNNFARTLNIPLDIDGAVASIVSSKAKKVDLGNVNGDFFTNVTGVGLSARIARNVSDTTKRRYGRLAYAIVGLTSFIRHKPFRATIRDRHGGLQLHLETHQLIIANGRYHGGRLLASDASLDNRELLVFPLGGRSKFSFALRLIDFYVGRRKKVAHSSYMIGRDFEIITDSPQPVELDGEVKLHTPLKASIEPAAVRIRYPD
jgi:diacylglycerol kinase (ATP)